MLSIDVVNHILAAIPTRKIGVLGDLFLDRYLDLEPELTEPSIETGLDAYQVTAVRSYPGAAGTVINNLAALGAGTILPASMIGDDGEGCELRQALARMPCVDQSNLVVTRQRRTPTYTKPMLAGRELNRLDIKNRAPVPTDVETRLLDLLPELWESCDGLLVLDQVSEAECGVVTARVRERLAELGQRDSAKIVIADSRERIGLFRQVWLKPNERECLRAGSNEKPLSRDGRGAGEADLSGAVIALADRSGRPVFCTRGEAGMLVAEPGGTLFQVPTYPVSGPIDPVGAGDSSSAALLCALISGASRAESAAFANLIASITIQQMGATGTANPEQVRARWREVSSAG